MSNLILLFSCMAIGILFKRMRLLPDSTAHTLNSFIIAVSLPALTLAQIPKISWNREMLLPALMPWLVFALSCVFFAILGRVRGWSVKVSATLCMLGGFCNSSFIGFPVVHALYGDSGLRIALIIDQLGSFLAVSTVGIFVATIFGSTQTGPFDWKIPALRVIRFPPFIATVIALVLSFWGVPPLLQPVFDRLGQTLAPLALVSIGFTLKFDLQRLKAWAEPLAYGLLYKLALAPLLITAVALGLGFDRHSQIFQVTVLEAAMASMMTAGIIAEQQGLDSELISLMYGVGIPLSGLTLTCVYWLL